LFSGSFSAAGAEQSLRRAGHAANQRCQDQRRGDRLTSMFSREFERLIQAAETGKTIESISGPDRAIVYILATWTGFRRRDLSSLTRKSLELEGETPLLRVRPAYSKRRQNDVVPLHPYVVSRLKDWLSTKPKASVDSPLFALKTPRGLLRRTLKMMKRDLAAA
jgi:integrase